MRDRIGSKAESFNLYKGEKPGGALHPLYFGTCSSHGAPKELAVLSLSAGSCAWSSLTLSLLFLTPLFSHGQVQPFT